MKAGKISSFAETYGQHAPQAVAYKAAFVSAQRGGKAPVPQSSRTVGQFAQCMDAGLHFGQRVEIGSPMADMGKKNPVFPFPRRIPAYPHMPRYEAVGTETQVPVLIIYGRQEQRIANGHPPMLPAGINAMVVIIVGTADLVRDCRGGVMIDGACLVLAVKVFIDHAGDVGVAGQGKFQAQQAVFPAIFAEKLRMVVELMLKVGTKLPVLHAPFHGKIPTAQHVAHDVGLQKVIPYKIF